MPLVLRNVKQTELTWAELDGNFTYLEDYIAQVSEDFNGAEVVRATPQEFLPAQMDQIRANIGGASLAVVNDLSDRMEFQESIEFVTYTLQTPTPEKRQLLRDNADVYSKSEVNGLIDAVGPGVSSVKQIVERTYNAAELSESIVILNLSTVLNPERWYDLYIEGLFISDNDYSVTPDSVLMPRELFGIEPTGTFKVVFKYYTNV